MRVGEVEDVCGFRSLAGGREKKKFIAKICRKRAVAGEKGPFPLALQTAGSLRMTPHENSKSYSEEKGR
jgi:hypothetical protein